MNKTNEGEGVTLESIAALLSEDWKRECHMAFHGSPAPELPVYPAGNEGETVFLQARGMFGVPDTADPEALLRELRALGRSVARDLGKGLATRAASLPDCKDWQVVSVTMTDGFYLDRPRLFGTLEATVGATWARPLSAGSSDPAPPIPPEEMGDWGNAAEGWQ